MAADLADIANDDGTSIFPSVPYLAWRQGDEDCGVSQFTRERTVKRELKELRDIGVLELVSEYRVLPNGTKVPRGGRRSNGSGYVAEYRLVEEKLPVRRPWAARRSNGDKTNSDNLTPLANGSPDAAAVTVKGDKNDTFQGGKGVTGVTQPVSDPPEGSVYSPSGLNDAAPATPVSPIAAPDLSRSVRNNARNQISHDGNGFKRERQRRQLRSQLGQAEQTANHARSRYDAAVFATGRTERQAQNTPAVKTAKQALDAADAAYAAAAKAVRELDRDPEDPVPKQTPAYGTFVNRVPRTLRREMR